MRAIRSTSSLNLQQTSSPSSEVTAILSNVQELLRYLQEKKLGKAKTICLRLLDLVPSLQTHDPLIVEAYSDRPLEFFVNKLKAKNPPYDKKMVAAFLNLIQKILQNVQEQRVAQAAQHAMKNFKGFIELLELSTQLNPSTVPQSQAIFIRRCQVLEYAVKSKKPLSSDLFARAVAALAPHEALLAKHRITVETGNRTITCWLFAFYLRASDRFQQEKKLESVSDAAFKLLDDYLNMREIEWNSISNDTLEEIAPFIRASIADPPPS